MTDEKKTPEATLAVISAQLNMMNQNIMDNFKNIRDDIRRIEDANRASIEALEKRIGEKIESTNKRVAALEEVEKKNIAIQTKHAVGYSAGSATIVLLISEFIKRMH